MRAQRCVKKLRAPAAAQSLQRGALAGREGTGAPFPPLLRLLPPGTWCPDRCELTASGASGRSPVELC